MKLEVGISCPNCGVQFRQRVGEMRPGAQRQCPHCGVEIQFAGDDGAKAQSALDDLTKTLGRLR